MCNFCNFKFESNLDSFAYGETEKGFFLLMNMENDNDPYTLNLENHKESLSVLNCPKCGNNLYYSYCYRSDDPIWKVLEKE